MTRPTLILFDVDGTLVDSNYLHTLAWSRALRVCGEWAPMNAIHRLIGMGSDALLRELIGRDDQAITDHWREEYELLIGEVQPFPHARDLLVDLASAGITVALATSSPAAHLGGLVDLLDVADVIVFSTNADDVTTAKPHPEIFLAAMQRGDGEPSSTVVVGDSRWDVEAAAAAGLRCIGVESGGFSAAELRDAGAAEVYRDVADLRDRFRTEGRLLSP